MLCGKNVHELNLILSFLLLHLLSFQNLVALWASLLLLLRFALKPFLETIRVEEVLAGRNPQKPLMLLEWIDADDTLGNTSKLKLGLVRRVVDVLQLLQEFLDTHLFDLSQLILQLPCLPLGYVLLCELPLQPPHLIDPELVCIPVRIWLLNIEVNMSSDQKALAAPHTAQAAQCERKHH